MICAQGEVSIAALGASHRAALGAPWEGAWRRACLIWWGVCLVGDVPLLVVCVLEECKCSTAGRWRGLRRAAGKGTGAL